LGHWGGGGGELAATAGQVAEYAAASHLIEGFPLERGSSAQDLNRWILMCYFDFSFFLWIDVDPRRSSSSPFQKAGRTDGQNLGDEQCESW
jgi:hypothetical protein